MKEQIQKKEDHLYQFINSYYIPEKYGSIVDKNNNRSYQKIRDDAIIIIYKKDNDQFIQVIENPSFSFYCAKPDIQINHYIDNLEIDKTNLITIKYHDLNKVLAEMSGRLNDYFDLKRNNNFYGGSGEDKYKKKREFINELQKNPRFFGSDVDINDYYKLEFVKKYGIHIGGYKKLMYDIETDGLCSAEQHKFPINVIGMYDFTTNTFCQLVWDQPDRWKTLNLFKEKVLNGEYEKEIKADPQMNGQFEIDKAIKEGKKLEDANIIKSVKDTKIQVEFIEDEYDLICRFFELIHTFSPDFALAWNFTFDLIYLTYRLQELIDRRHLDVDINDIICDHNIPKKYRIWSYKEDRNPKHLYFQKWHIINIPGKTVYLDAMATYAHIRKSAGLLPSYQLNDISMKELNGKGKVDYSDLADDPSKLPYKDFTLHAHYNFRDVWLLVEMECKSNDIDSIMYMAECTQLPNVTKSTSVLKNSQELFYFNNNLAIGNNHNALITQEVIPYRGAIVADTSLNEPIMTPLSKFPSKLIRPFVMDNDLTSMYPMINIAHNIYKTTLLFHINKIGNVGLMDYGDPGVIDVEDMFDNYQVNQITRFSNDYLQLPDTEQLILDLDKELNNINNKEGIDE